MDEVQLVMKAKSRALLLADKERYIQAVDNAVEGAQYRHRRPHFHLYQRH